MTIPQGDNGAFDDLPTFDARRFEPPAWAKGPEFQKWRDGAETKNGESSKSHLDSHSAGGETSNSQTEVLKEDTVDDEEDDDEEEEEIWEDARSVVEPEEARFTTPELKELLSRASKYKAEGNGLFTAKQPKYEEAIKAYESAVDHLPLVPRKEVEKDKDPNGEEGGSGIEEVTDEEAEAIRAEAEREISEEERERGEVEEEIRELTKACWGNLAACHVALKDDKKAVKACDSALEIDPNYTKALHRRATANERIGSATALSSAQQDYKALISLLPNSSPQLPTIRRSLATLPTRIQEQQQKEMNEALGQLKELGNKFLGTFGLSTDMFKMDKAPDGSYSMKFGN